MIKQLLKNNQTVQRITAIKDLFLEKLDNIIFSLEQQQKSYQQQGQKLLENQNFLLRSAVDTSKGMQLLFENYRSLFEHQQNFSTQQQSSLASIQANLDGVHGEFANIRKESDSYHQVTAKSLTTFEQEFVNIRQESENYYKLLIEKLHTVENESREQDYFARQNLAQIASALEAQKYRVVTDPAYFQSVDIELMVYLYSHLPHRRAIDVGANRGDVSARLLDAGYEVYAFEPFPPVREKLEQRLGDRQGFHSFPYALGASEETKELHLVTDSTEDKVYDDPSLYSSLTLHSLVEGLSFTSTIPVTVQTLGALHHSQQLPDDIGLVKIDTEGYDLEVIRGMGDCRYPVVVAEFWDAQCPFGQTGAMNHLKDLVPAMRQRGYNWHIVIYRIWGQHDVSYYCNSSYSLEKSWGNVFFFQDHTIFQQALQWCNAVMPATYFSV